MGKLPKKCLVDTNVPKNANLALEPASIPIEMEQCVFACIEAVEFVIKKGKLVIDAGDEIYNEYRINLSMSGQPGVGDRFMKWVHDHRWNSQKTDRVTITRYGDSFKEFPQHDGLSKSDLSDRKFVTVAHAHAKRPPILEATDSKWWGWKEALEEVGIEVKFICPDYIERKYHEKTCKHGIEFYKYPSTPHVIVLPGVSVRNDKVLSAEERKFFLSHELIVEEED